MQAGILDIITLPHLLRRQWWSAERVRANQEEQFLQLFHHAFTNVKVYRDLWRSHGVDPSQIRSLDDLALLPVVDTRWYRSQPQEDRLSCNADISRAVEHQTSGSTGCPVTILVSRAEHFHLFKALSVRFYFAHGVGVSARQARFHEDMPFRRAWHEHLRAWRVLKLNPRATTDEWIRQLRDYRPDSLSGMPVTLLELAREVRRQNVSIRPRIVFCSGCRLESFDRTFLSETFGAKVVDVYGSHEGGFLAWECPECEAYHVNADTAIVEVLRDGKPAGPGETGDVVVTNLRARLTPFIRYGVGDIATVSAKTPRCGRNLPLLDQIWGRRNDFIKLPSGKSLSQYKLTLHISYMKWIREWQFVQERDGNCMLFAVPGGNGERPDPAEIERTLETALLNEVRVSLQLVDEIPRDLKVKFKPIRSMVPDRD